MALVLGAQFAGDDFKVNILPDHNVSISYFWRTLFVSCWTVNGFEIVNQSYSRVNYLMWFLSSSLAGYVSGVIAGIMSVPKEIGSVNQREISFIIYTQNFESLAFIAFAVAILLFFSVQLSKNILRYK